MTTGQTSKYPERALTDSVVAWRRDGFCERLVTILNGKILAEHFGIQHWFTWPTEETLRPTYFKNYENPAGILSDFEALFSHSVLQAHYLDEVTTDLPVMDFIGKQYFIGSPVVLNSVKSFKKRKSGLDFWLAPSRLKPEVDALVDKSELPKFFRQDLFTDYANDMMAAVDKLVLPEKCVAIHYRSGDVIHGGSRIRFANPLWKTISLAVAAHFCEMYTNKGVSVYVLGATKSELIYLSKRFEDVYSIYDFDLPEGDISENILRDLVLMSRCQKLISAGGSGVTELAGYLGPVENISKSDLLTSKQEEAVLRAAITSEEFKGYLQRQQAFTYFNLFFAAENASFAELDGWLQAAYSLDEKNYHYLALRYINALAHSKPIIANESAELFRLRATTIDAKHSVQARKKMKEYLRLNNKKTTEILRTALNARDISWEDYGIVEAWINKKNFAPNVKSRK